MGLIQLGGISFSILNFFMAHYTLYFLVIVYALGLLIILMALNDKPILQYLAIACISIVGILNWNNNKRFLDTDFSYTSHVKSIQELYRELQIPKYNGKKIGMKWPANQGCCLRDMGYVDSTNFAPQMVYDTLENSLDYFIATYPGNIADTITYMDQIELAKEFRSEWAYSRIYSVIKIHKDSIQ
jgi:hypothetical protein